MSFICKCNRNLDTWQWLFICTFFPFVDTSTICEPLTCLSWNCARELTVQDVTITWTFLLLTTTTGAQGPQGCPFSFIFRVGDNTPSFCWPFDTVLYTPPPLVRKQSEDSPRTVRALFTAGRGLFSGMQNCCRMFCKTNKSARSRMINSDLILPKYKS